MKKKVLLLSTIRREEERLLNLNKRRMRNESNLSSGCGSCFYVSTS